jgi:hypothetical protein
MRTLSLSLELWRWRRAGRTARLWWRDDDAAGASAKLDKLLLIAWESGVPLTLAAVPAGDMAGLAAILKLRLATATGRITVAQHGVDHRNRRSGPEAGEFPDDWTQDELKIALRRGWSLIQGLPNAAPIYVPPWNDAHPALEAALVACGYAGWSVNGEMAAAESLPGARLPRVDVHLDLLRWRGGARFRGAGRFLNGLAGELRRRRRAGLWAAPIGILTHHLAHDPAAWAFLEGFLSWSALRPEFRWAALPDLIAETGDGRTANDRAHLAGETPYPPRAASDMAAAT